MFEKLIIGLQLLYRVLAPPATEWSDAAFGKLRVPLLLLYRVIIPLTTIISVLILSPILTHNDIHMSFLELVIRVVVAFYYVAWSWGISNIIQGVWAPDRIPELEPVFVFFGIIGLAGGSVAMCVFNAFVFLLLFPGIGHAGALAIGLASVMLTSTVFAYWMKKTYFGSKHS